MIDTPRTDSARHDEHDPYMAIASECSKLERELNAANQRINQMEEIIPILMRGIDRTLKGSADRYFAAYRKAEQLLKLNAHEDHNTNASHRASGAVHKHSV